MNVLLWVPSCDDFCQFERGPELEAVVSPREMHIFKAQPPPTSVNSLIGMLNWLGPQIQRVAGQSAQNERKREHWINGLTH